MGAAADCERMVGRILGQPVNSVTTMAFVVAGIVVATRRPQRSWIGVGLVATGAGSFLFHGPMPAGSGWAHDVTLAWLILMVAGSLTRWERATAWPGLVALGGVFAVGPGLADPIAVVLTVAALFLLLRTDSPAVRGPVILLAVSAVVGRLGATGWPLCRPDSLLQPHGLWHLGAATAVVWWALATPVRGPAEDPSPAPSR